jgi:hypothetical protein
MTPAKTLKKTHTYETIFGSTLRLDLYVAKAGNFVIENYIWMIEIWTPLRNESVFSSKNRLTRWSMAKTNGDELKIVVVSGPPSNSRFSECESAFDNLMEF